MLISPLGGEQWSVGSSYAIGWDTNNVQLPQIAKLTIDVISAEDNAILDTVVLTSPDATAGIAHYTVPSKIVGKKFYVRLAIADSSTDQIFYFSSTNPITSVEQTPILSCGQAKSIVTRAEYGDGRYSSLGLDISQHPEIMRYRIQWSDGAWSGWYTPGVDDVDWKVNTNGTQRRAWSYFDDHKHEVELCQGLSLSVPIITGPTSLYVNDTGLFGATAKNSEAGNLTYKFDWGDGSALDTKILPSGTSYVISHSWKAAGIYGVVVSVDDGKGGTNSASINVKVSERLNSGSVSVSLNSTLAAGTISAGAKAVTLAKINVSTSTSPVLLKGIKVGSDSINAENTFSNLLIYMENTLLGRVTKLTYNGEYYYGWVEFSPYQLSGDSTKVITIKADISSSVLATVRLGIWDLKFNDQVKVSDLPINGPNMRIAPARRTGAATDSDNSPDYSKQGISYPISREKYPDLFIAGVGKGDYIGGLTPCIYGLPSSSFCISTNESFSTYYDHCAGSKQLNEAYVKSDGRLGAMGVSLTDGYYCANGVVVEGTSTLPDLVIESISLDPPTPQPGKKLTINAVIKNIGMGKALVYGSNPLSGPAVSLRVTGENYQYTETISKNVNNKNPLIPPGGKSKLSFGVTSTNFIILPRAGTYNYKVVIDEEGSPGGVISEVNEDNNSVESVVVSNQAEGSTTPIVSQIKSNSAVISWSTNEPTIGTVHYGFGPSMVDMSYMFTDPKPMSTSHSVTLTNLIADKIYFFKVEGKNSAGNYYSTPASSFRTLLDFSESYKIKVITPNGGETLITDQPSLISWTGGRNKLHLGLIDPAKISANNDGWLGYIATNIQLTPSGMGSYEWKTDKVCDINGNNCQWLRNFTNNKFKVVFISEDANGNYCQGGEGLAVPCNYDFGDDAFTIQTVASPACAARTIIRRSALGNPGGTGPFEKLGLDTSAHPEILRYRIQWFSGGWSDWYIPGQNDIDWLTNLDGTKRRVWSYFDDHTHEYEVCGPASASTPPLLGVNVPAIPPTVIQSEATSIAQGEIVQVAPQANLDRAEELMQKAQVIIAKMKDLQRQLDQLKPELETVTKFIALGTASTEHLSVNDRAAVVSSYQNVFGQAPTTDDQWKDVVKIATGQVPDQSDSRAEAQASKIFKTIYKRSPNKSNQADNTAVKTIAYGLQPQERNIKLEQAAIKTFKSNFRRMPKSNADWNIVRSMAYSGAKK